MGRIIQRNKNIFNKILKLLPYYVELRKRAKAMGKDFSMDFGKEFHVDRVYSFNLIREVSSLEPDMVEQGNSVFLGVRMKSKLRLKKDGMASKVIIDELDKDSKLLNAAEVLYFKEIFTYKWGYAYRFNEDRMHGLMEREIKLFSKKELIERLEKGPNFKKFISIVNKLESEIFDMELDGQILSRLKDRKLIPYLEYKEDQEKKMLGLSDDMINKVMSDHKRYADEAIIKSKLYSTLLLIENKITSTNLEISLAQNVYRTIKDRTFFPVAYIEHKVPNILYYSKGNSYHLLQSKGSFFRDIQRHSMNDVVDVIRNNLWNFNVENLIQVKAPGLNADIKIAQ